MEKHDKNEENEENKWLSTKKETVWINAVIYMTKKQISAVGKQTICCQKKIHHFHRIEGSGCFFSVRKISVLKSSTWRALQQDDISKCLYPSYVCHAKLSHA